MSEKENRQKRKRFWKSVLTVSEVIFGNVLFALVVELFLVPSGLVTAGATGIALAINHLTGFSISVFVFIFNLIALLLGWVFIGKTFALTTILSSFVYPVAIEVFERIFEGYVLTDDLLLCTLFSGIGMGIALGVVFRAGSSTGGMDVAPLLLYKYTKIPVSVGMYAFDIIILLAQVFISETDKLLYGVIAIFIYTFVIDKVMILGANKLEVKVVSDKHQEISQAISAQADRGVTLIYAEGGYLHQRTQIVFSVISDRELARLERLIHDIDPECFMVVTRVNEVSGRGFSTPKTYLEKNDES